MISSVRRFLSPLLSQPKQVSDERAPKPMTNPESVATCAKKVFIDPLYRSICRAIIHDDLEGIKRLVLTPEDASRALVYLCSTAISQKHVEIAHYLLKSSGADANASNEEGTALDQLCLRMKRLASPEQFAILHLLLSYNAAPNGGRTPLLEITMNAEAVNLLLAQGAEPTLLSMQNALLREEPCLDVATLLLAAWKKKFSEQEVIQMLINLLTAGKMPNFEIPAMMMYPKSIIFLLEQGAIPDQSHIRSALLKGKLYLDAAELFINMEVPMDLDCLQMLRQHGREDLCNRWTKGSKHIPV